jgi:hypothetical protein
VYRTAATGCQPNCSLYMYTHIYTYVCVSMCTLRRAAEIAYEEARKIFNILRYFVSDSVTLKLLNISNYKFRFILI